MRPLVPALALALGLASGVARAQSGYGIAFQRPCRSPVGLAPSLELTGDTFRWCGNVFTLDGRHVSAHPWESPEERASRQHPAPRRLPEGASREAIQRAAAAVSRDGRVALIDEGEGHLALYDLDARRRERGLAPGALLGAAPSERPGTLRIATLDPDDAGFALTEVGTEGSASTTHHALPGVRAVWPGEGGRALAWVGPDRLVLLSTVDDRSLATRRFAEPLTRVEPDASLQRVVVHTDRGLSLLTLEGGRFRTLLRAPRARATALVEGGRTLLVHEHDGLLTAWREGATTATLPTAPELTLPEGWYPTDEAYDWWVPYQHQDGYPHALRRGDGRGLIAAWQSARGAATTELYASDASEFARAGEDRRAWARAVVARFGQNNALGGRPTLDTPFVHDVSVWRLPDRARAISWWQHASNRPFGLDYRNHVLVFERGPWLYRVEVHLPDRPCPATCAEDCVESVACTDEGARAILRAFFDGALGSRAEP